MSLCTDIMKVDGLPGFLSAFCPRGDKMRLYGFFGWQAHIHVQACGKLGGSRGMLPRGNFDFGPFIRRSLVESAISNLHCENLLG